MNLRKVVSGIAFVSVVSASGVASAEETTTPSTPSAPMNVPAAVQRARVISYVVMSAGVAAIATGVGLYAYGASHFPDGCTLQSCDVRTTDGAVSTGAVPCARDMRQDGCAGSAYNVQRQAEAGRAEVMKTTGAVTAVAGSVALATGMILWLRTPSSERPARDKSTLSQARVLPLVSLGFGGVGVVADF